MITDIIRVLDDAVAEWTACKPLTVWQWVQRRRLQRAARALRLYARECGEPYAELPDIEPVPDHAEGQES